MRLSLMPAVAALGSLLSVPTAAQWINYQVPGIPRLPDGKPNLSAPAPRTAEGKPDLNGVWRGGGGRYDYDVAPNLKPEDIRPWAADLLQQRVRDFRKDSPLARCLPVSLPFQNSRSLSRIVQTPGVIVMLYEAPNSPHRTIYTDGRQLPKDPSPTWMGYSVGHWDGDTLVVDSVGFNDKGWLDVGGHPNTEALRITERFRRRDFGHLELEMTLDDPETFAKPVVMRMEKVLSPDNILLEDVCENERDQTHLESGIKVAPEVLSKYAGAYEFSPGGEAVVTIAGGQLYAQRSANATKLLFVARTETTFLASVTNDSLEFVKDAQGAVTHLIWHDGRGADQKAARKTGGR